MKLENQCVSLELAKKLKELGVKQESYFRWYQTYGGVWALGDATEATNNAIEVSNTTAWQINELSAFTVAELGEMLPDFTHSWRIVVITDNGRKEWMVQYRPAQPGILHDLFANTEADARAKMLIYLLENKLITH